MNKITLVLFFLSFLNIFIAMVGYPLFIKLLGKMYVNRTIKKDYYHKPTVTIMVVAHNEEKVIEEKLKNITKLDYPKDKIKYIVTSDFSTDGTNDIVYNFINSHEDYDIRLYQTQNRKGKTNAQNEAQKTVETDFLVMTDANSFLDSNSISEIMATFVSDDIAYVTGRLIYTNDQSVAGKSEISYWDSEIQTRFVEGRIQTITAGNGALYACRNKDYVDFDLIESHDSAMPLYFSLQGRRAVSNNDACAYEKTGDTVQDEFKRKIRMNRIIIRHILPTFRILNIFKYKWFTIFYLGHRTARYLLWISHAILLITSILASSIHPVFTLILLLQVIFYLIAIMQQIFKFKNKFIVMIYYYSITILAQWIAVIKILLGKSKPFWEKADSTR